MKKRKNRLYMKKGFTLVELIVVMAVIAILVLLAAPRLLGKTQQAQATRIHHDVRVVSGVVTETLAEHPEVLAEWVLADPTQLETLVSEGRLIGVGGPAQELPAGDFKLVAPDLVKDAGSRLDGTFYTNEDGAVWYESKTALPVVPDAETPDAGIPAPTGPLTKAEWDRATAKAGYEVATDSDFVAAYANYRYTGNEEYVIVPEAINGKPLTKTYKMFDAASSKTVKGVAMYNEAVTDTSSMFEGAPSTELDLSYLNTPSVTNMRSMFRNAKATRLDLTAFDTANVTNMSNMFDSTQAITLDLSSFDATRVTNVDSMFTNAKATTVQVRTQKELDKFSHAKASKPSGLTLSRVPQTTDYVLATDADFVGDTNGEFRYNGVYQYITLPHTIKGVPVTSYYCLFEGTDVLGVRSDNAKVTDMRYMFKDSKAPQLDVSKLDTSGVKNMDRMFWATQATTIDLSFINTSQVTSMSSMFWGAKATALDLSSFDTVNVTNMSTMFYFSKTSNLDLSSFDTSNVTDMHSMFEGAQASNLNLSSFVTSNVTNMSGMFRNSQATTLDLSSFDATRVTDVGSMFANAKAKTVQVRTQKERDKFNSSSYKPSTLTFTIK